MSGSKKNLKSLLSHEQRKSLIDHDIEIGLSRQCELLEISRSSLYYKPKPISEEQLKLLKLIDELYTQDPYFGTRRMREALVDYGVDIGRDKIGSCYKKLGLEAIYSKANLSKRNHEHKVYPYLLRHMKINRVNQVWSADVTFIRLSHGFVYLVAIIDWHSRRILSWKLSTTLTADFCVEALQEALAKYPAPDIFNTDQGSTFTAQSFIEVLVTNKISISMDGRGRALDNVFIERFWRSLKQEKIYLMELNSVHDAKMAIDEYMQFYNFRRKHQSLKYKTPHSFYYENLI